jgi:hypothetical protein
MRGSKDFKKSMMAFFSNVVGMSLQSHLVVVEWKKNICVLGKFERRLVLGRVHILLANPTIKPIAQI